MKQYIELWVIRVAIHCNVYVDLKSPDPAKKWESKWQTLVWFLCALAVWTSADSFVLLLAQG